MHDPDEGVTADGLITTGARRDRVPARFEPLIASVAGIAQAGPASASVYLYGSVATGQALPGRSDVDLLTVGVPEDLAATWGAALSERFSGLCRGVECAPAQPDHLVGEGDAAYGNRVFLRHYCVHLHGPDLRAGFPAFPADARAARGFNGDLVDRARGWRAELSSAADSSAALGRRLARKTLLAVAGLVSIHDATWTTDRRRAAERWAGLHPELAPALAQLVVWGEDEQTAFATELAVALGDNGVVARIEDAFATRIGLWHTPKENS